MNINKIVESNQFPAEEVLKELRRELEVRKAVYPRWIGSKKISRKVAELRLDLLKCAIAKLEEEETPEKESGEQQKLF
jgi:hypothetical protein